MTRDLKAALRVVAEALPAGVTLPIVREDLLAILGDDEPHHRAGPPAPAAPADRLLTAREAAARLGVSTRYLYAHRRDYPFTKRLPSGPLRFSDRGLTRFLEQS